MRLPNRDRPGDIDRPHSEVILVHDPETPIGRRGQRLDLGLLPLPDLFLDLDPVLRPQMTFEVTLLEPLPALEVRAADFAVIASDLVLDEVTDLVLVEASDPRVLARSREVGIFLQKVLSQSRPLVS